MGLSLGCLTLAASAMKPAALGVFQESPGEHGVQRVRSRHRRREIVDDQVLGDAAEESPDRFQPGDDILQRLAEGGPDEAVPGVSQHHDQGPTLWLIRVNVPVNFPLYRVKDPGQFMLMFYDSVTC